jgi:hypothetical protein
MTKKCSEVRVCEVCNTTYIAKVVTARFCSLKCMYVWRSTLPKKPRQKKQPVIKVLGTKNCLYCGKSFDILKNRKTLCSRRCMYEWRKAQHREAVQCLNCGKEFVRYKNGKHPRTGLQKKHCSDICARTSDEKKEKLRTWGLSNKNHWNNLKVQSKVKVTKKERYGDENYNNMEKNIKTCNQKYGVPYSIIVMPKANGKRISKPQQKVYDNVLKEHPDAVLEHWLRDVQKSVDVYIPSTNTIIEIYGTYWHCDPRKYSGEYYNKSIKLTAQEIWERDKKRKLFLESLGYAVKIFWESDVNL